MSSVDGNENATHQVFEHIATVGQRKVSNATDPELTTSK